MHAYASHTFVTKSLDEVVYQMGLCESIHNDNPERKEDAVHAMAKMFEVLTKDILQEELKMPDLEGHWLLRRQYTLSCRLQRLLKHLRTYC